MRERVEEVVHTSPYQSPLVNKGYGPPHSISLPDHDQQAGNHVEEKLYHLPFRIDNVYLGPEVQVYDFNFQTY